MIRGVLLAGLLTLLTAISIPSFGSTSDTGPEQLDEHAQPSESVKWVGRAQPSRSVKPDERAQPLESEKPEGREEWRERLLVANQEVVAAEKRVTAARSAYRDMRQRRRPRGDAKQAIMDEIELSREGLTIAQQDLESLESAARRAGAPPSWLKFDPAKIDPATPLPASPEP